MNRKLMTETMLHAAVGATIFVLAGPAGAETLTGTGDPLSNQVLAGGTQITFSEPGSFQSYTENGLTISGPVRVTSEFANSLNTTGSSLDNNRGGTPSLHFSFSEPVGAFAFNFGGTDMVWTLSAFSGTQLLETLQIPPTLGSNKKDYFGLTGANITSATLVGAGDWVFIDNFTFNSSVASAVPEPSTWAMMIGGFGLVGGAMRSDRRRKRSRQASFA